MTKRYCSGCGKVFEYEPREPAETRCPACGRLWVAPVKTGAGNVKEEHCSGYQYPPNKGANAWMAERKTAWGMIIGIMTCLVLVGILSYFTVLRLGPPANSIPPDGCVCGETSGGRNCAVAIDIHTDITCGIWTDLSPETLRGIDGITWVSKDGSALTRDPRYGWGGILDDICALHID